MGHVLHCVLVGFGSIAAAGLGLWGFVWANIKIACNLRQRFNWSEDATFAGFFLGWVWVALGTVTTLHCLGILH